MRVFRAFWPNLVLTRQVVKAYENNGTAVVTRRADVHDVLNRDEEFAVVYGPRMRQITRNEGDENEGKNFFLGMQPGWEYTRDTSVMRLSARADDIDRIKARATEVANEAVEKAGKIIDLPQDVGLKTSSDLVATYFGTPGPSRADMIEWTTVMFWYLFGDLGASETLAPRAFSAMAASRAYLDKAIAQRKANPTEDDDVLNRCLALQAAGTPGLELDEDIRNNIVGLLIGAVPTLSKASCLALDELLRRPDELHGAQKAARVGDDALLAKYIWEALRFNPHQPLLYRRATRDATIARGTLREVTIPKGRIVFAMTLSADFDTMDVPAANEFRTDRPEDFYMTWGYGMHNCFGEVINRVVIPAILKPVLRKKNLRYADGWDAIDKQGTPFPAHMKLTCDPD
ncbi:cytochrome P450 [Rhodobacteraceae bacterium NNCM2]|nr:cytochrome P450 [Coraliihabitans acroporae]